MEVHEMRKVRSVGAGSLALQQASVHHAMAYICECGEKWVFTRDEVDTKEAHNRACVCGRTGAEKDLKARITLAKEGLDVSLEIRLGAVERLQQADRRCKRNSCWNQALSDKTQKPHKREDRKDCRSQQTEKAEIEQNPNHKYA